MYASTHTSGHEVVVCKLLAAPKIDVNTADHEGLTSLRIAARHGYERAIGRLLAHPGINVNMSNYGRETSWDMVVTQVHAVTGESLENTVDKTRSSALAIAIYNRPHYGVINKFLAAPAYPSVPSLKVSWPSEKRSGSQA